MVFEHVDLQAIFHGEGLRDGKVKGDVGTGRGWGFAPVLLLFKLRRVGRGEFGVSIRVLGAARNVVNHFFAGDTVDDDALVFAEVFAGDLLDGGDGCGLVAGDVFGEIVGVVEKLVVAIERVGYSAKAAEALEADDLAGDVDGTGAVEFGLGGSFGLQAGYFFPEGGFESVEGDSGFGGDVAAGDGAELEVVEIAGDGLGDLLLVDELAVETAGFAAAEDVDDEVSFGVARGEDGRGEPCDGETRELDGVGYGGAFLGGDRRRFDGDGLDLETIPTEPSLWIRPGIIPTLALPGEITPGQFGPISRDLDPLTNSQTFTISSTGIPSVIQITKGTSAAAASRIPSAAAGGGTKITETFAPVSFTASSTVLKTGHPSCVVPPLPGVTPPTTLVPYSAQPLA